MISVEPFYYNYDRQNGRYESRGPNNGAHYRENGTRRRDQHNRNDSKPYRRGERAPRRVKKTLEELDAELTNYMNGGSGEASEQDTNNNNNNDSINNSANHDDSNGNTLNRSSMHNSFSNFDDSSSNNTNVNNNSTAAESSANLQSQTQRDDDNMVLD